MYARISLLFLAPAMLLLAAGPAYAAGPAPRSTVPAAVSAAEEGEEEELEAVEEVSPAEECAEAQSEYAAGEIDAEELELFCEAEPGESSPQAQPCPLRSAHAHAATSHDRLKVTLGYTAHEPFTAKLRLSNHLGTLKRHLGRSGAIRFTRQLHRKHPRKLALQLRPVGATGCPSPRLVLFLPRHN